MTARLTRQMVRFTRLSDQIDQIDGEICLIGLNDDQIDKIDGQIGLTDDQFDQINGQIGLNHGQLDHINGQIGLNDGQVDLEQVCAETVLVLHFKQSFKNKTKM